MSSVRRTLCHPSPTSDDKKHQRRKLTGKVACATTSSCTARMASSTGVCRKQEDRRGSNLARRARIRPHGDPVACIRSAERRPAPREPTSTCNLRRYNSGMASTPTAVRTFRLTLDLFDAGVQLMRQNLRRGDPRADEQEINRRLGTWLRQRPGADAGDSSGRLVDVDTRIG